MNIYKHIPNAITAMNLVMGCFGIYFALNNNLVYSSYCIGLAAIFDFMDGAVARALNVSSNIGKELDSLADVVSFGVLPGFIIFQMISVTTGDNLKPLTERSSIEILYAMFGFAIPVFSAIRLAKFNLDKRQKDHFLGLPTPAMTLIVSSIPLILEMQYDLTVYYVPSTDALQYMLSVNVLTNFDLVVIKLLFNKWFYVVLVVTLCWMMISEVKLFSLKFKGLTWYRNKTRIIFLSLSALLFVLVYLTRLYFFFMPLVIFFYITVSIGYYIYKKNK